MQVLISILSALFLLFSNNCFAAKTDFFASDAGGSKSRIITSFYHESGQKKLIAGFEVQIEEGWKIYAPDDSGFGIAPSFDFKNSKNIDITKTNPIFPEAHVMEEKIGDEVIKYKVYKQRVIIPIELEVQDIKNDVDLNVTVNYGLCKEICIPAMQQFSIKIPSGEIDSESSKEIQKFVTGKKIYHGGAPSNGLPTDIGLIKALIVAFIGGLILNIMPCVLPVLSIKLISVIDQTKARLIRIRFAFFSTILGIVFCFSVFAIITVILKSIGSSVGWGLQFQNSYFLLFLLIVLMIFTANLVGLFEFNFNSSISSSLNNKINSSEKRKHIFFPNFLSGVLAVLLATPCSAPFVGVAVSFALSSSIKEIFMIFFVMALGLAFPYIILFAYPKAIRYLPRPGRWMIKVKNLMAGFLLATAAWLIYVLMDQLGFIPACAAGLLAILILLFFKVVHKIDLTNRPELRSGVKVFALMSIFFLIVASIIVVPNGLVYLDKMMHKSESETWTKFDESKIEAFVADGKTVVIDITADWCITCKANKLLVLNNKEIQNKLKDPDIVAMRGDLTKPDERIFNFIKKYNRFGIPFNIVFGPEAPDGILTSELLSKDALLDAISKASGKSQLPNE